MNKRHRLEHLTLQAAELENYESVISNLDQEVENVQNQIKVLKEQKQADKVILKELRDPNKISEKHLKYMKIQQKVLQDQVTLAKKYASSRAVISANLTRPENIAQLFESEKSGPSRKYPTEYVHDYEKDPLARQFSSPIRNSMMLLSHLLINTCLVELNLHFALYNKDVNDIFPLKKISRPGLFASMKLDKEKLELLQHLSHLRQSSMMASSKFKDLLIPTKVADLMLNSRQSDHFTSKEQRRYDMYIHRSGRWQNYDDSDTHKHILGIQGPVFRTNIVNNREYFKKFDKIFHRFKSNTKKKLRHVTLALEVSKILAKGGNTIPSNAIFRDLLDRLEDVNLSHFQSLVYDHLPQFSSRKTAWADGDSPHTFAERDVLHFHSIIEEDPFLLGSLFRYLKGNQRQIKSLLRFLEPTHAINLSGQSILPDFMTKMPNSELVGPDPILKEPILFRKSVLEQAMYACVYSKDYKSLDGLLTKLVYNLIETPGGLRIFSSGNFASEELVFNNYTSEELGKKLFNENILYMLGKAYVEQNDQRRCKWIAPLIQKSLKRGETERLSHVYDSVLQVLETLRIVEHKPSRAQSIPTNKETHIPKKTPKLAFKEHESMYLIDSVIT